MSWSFIFPLLLILLTACATPSPSPTPRSTPTPTLIPPPVQGPEVVGDGVEIEGWEYLGPEAVKSLPMPSANIREIDIPPYEIRLIKKEDGFELIWGALLCSTLPVVVVHAEATIEFWPGESVNPNCVEMEVFHDLIVQWQTDISFEEWEFILHPPPPPGT